MPSLGAGQPRWAAGSRAGRCTRTRKAITSCALNARLQSPRAGQLYAQAQALGKRNPHAAHVVARAWIRVIWACWHNGTPHDPHYTNRVSA